MSDKLKAGSPFPKTTVKATDGSSFELGSPSGDFDWQMVVVYRGKHCPLCTRYLNEMEALLPKFNELGIDVVAVSADPLEKAKAHLEAVNPSYKVGYDLTTAQMADMGLYISNPWNATETDRQFSEPGLFIVNEKGNLQIMDISNIPFARPSLESMVMGLNFVRNNDYPIRGTA